MLAYPNPRSLVLAVVLTGAMVLVPTVAMAQLGGEPVPGPPLPVLVPTGLVTVIANDPTQPLDLKPFENPNISGIALQIHWDDISPSVLEKQITQEPGEPPVIKYVPVEGPPDWTRLDELFAAAHKYHKWVQLLVFPGFFSPAWALVGAQTDQFAIQYGPGKGDVRTLPMPWDPVYLSNWSTFVNELADRYRHRPELMVVGVAGPTSVSVETTLPESAADLSEWLTDGYTNAKYIAAWQAMSEVYAANFPDQYLSLSAGKCLPINDKGEIDHNQPVITEQDVVDAVDANLQSQFTLQNSNLDGNASTATDPETLLVLSYIGDAVTGFQLRTNCQNNAKNMGAKGNPPLALRRSILNGTQPARTASLSIT